MVFIYAYMHITYNIYYYAIILCIHNFYLLKLIHFKFSLDKTWWCVTEE